MKKTSKNISNDLQGVTKLTVDAVKGVTSIVESMHSTIATFTGILGDPKKEAKGVSGMVYRNIRKITDIFGDGLDVMLGQLSQAIGDKPSFTSREAIIAASNGVLGDYLCKKDNPLAIQMSLRKNGKSLSQEQLFELIKQSEGKILILIHGLCMNDLHWRRNVHDHGQSLARDLGYTEIYLHYNTGKHISENGKQLSELLEQFSQHKVSLSFLTHSMGGLLARSACYYAEKSKHKWLQQCDKIVFLGTPHHGALLEKGGNWLNTLLKVSPYTAPFSKISSIRSHGITDLRYGNISDEDWNHQDKINSNKDERTWLELPKDIHFYAVASTIADQHESLLADKLVGDGLVTVNSALGIHEHKDINIPLNNRWIGTGINHNQLLENQEVYAVIHQWFA